MLAKVGILTFSEAVDFVQEEREGFCREVESDIAGALENAGHERPKGAA
jgi:hypothetical protein